MKAVLLLVTLLVVVVAALVALADATQNRPDLRVPGSETTLTFTVETRRYVRGEEAAAQALWTVCSATVGGRLSRTPLSVDDAWQVLITPSLGEHGRRRLVGCLEDVTIDRVIGDVVSLHSST